MEEPKKFFVDASVVLKWFFLDERDTQQAIALRDRFIEGKIELEVPAHAYSEVANTLLAKTSSNNALDFFATFRGMNLMEHALTLGTVSISSLLMKRYKGISFYDAVYHALALTQGGTFITADEIYYKKTKKEGSIVLLKDF